MYKYIFASKNYFLVQITEHNVVTDQQC